MSISFTSFKERRKKIADTIYFAGLFLLVAGLPLSLFLISISQFVLIGSWLIYGDYKDRAKRFFTDPVCLSIISLYAIHIIGLLYTTDFNYAQRDIRIKLPLIILPFIIHTSSSLSLKQFYLVLKLFVLACLVSSLISTGVWLQIVHRPVNDIRNISIFMSHIRLSLLICIAAFACAFFITKEDKQVTGKFSYALLIVWFIIFLIILQSLTGLIIGGITLIALVSQYLIRKKNYFALGGMICLFGAATFLSCHYVNREFKKLRTEDALDLNHLPKHTSRGNAYAHEFTNGDIENGHRIYMFVCYSELEQAWSKRSKIGFDSLDKRQQVIRYTLIRYMTSKGLYKDADGVDKLNEEDIKNVEQGIGSVNELNETGFQKRINATIWELNNFMVRGDPSGHTLAMRFEFWKASVSIIKKHIFFGVGTGDNLVELNTYYETSHTRLSKQFWLRSHNQFLAIGISFGLFGLAVFIFSLFYPLKKLQMQADYFYFTFFIIAIFSFLTEDTLETQAGATFFAFFNSFFLFACGNRIFDEQKIVERD